MTLRVCGGRGGQKRREDQVAGRRRRGDAVHAVGRGYGIGAPRYRVRVAEARRGRGRGDTVAGAHVSAGRRLTRLMLTLMVLRRIVRDTIRWTAELETTATVVRCPLVDPWRPRGRGEEGTRIPPGIHSTAGGAATANGAAGTCNTIFGFFRMFVVETASLGELRDCKMGETRQRKQKFIERLLLTACHARRELFSSVSLSVTQAVMNLLLLGHFYPG